ncbi:hypothetical protein MRB53_033118 [Persea americana]|uniref:Uncharacterized protein n=1 Tax=Persea americana TaxID=3435 RepID=A0ACC2KTZ7_PERAE|nr:hypothetical protein MRB53_033118 [Persea americana]
MIFTKAIWGPCLKGLKHVHGSVIARETGSRAKQKLQASISPEKIVQILTTSLLSVILRQLETTTPRPASPEFEKNRRRSPFPNFWLQSFGTEHKRKKTRPSWVSCN